MIVLENLTKTYKSPCGKVKALSGIGMLVEKGEFIALCGPSGSGKTTLLMTIAAMLRPTSGTVQIDQKNLYKMSVQERAKFRACTIGFVERTRESKVPGLYYRFRLPDVSPDPLSERHRERCSCRRSYWSQGAISIQTTQIQCWNICRPFVTRGERSSSPLTEHRQRTLPTG